MSVLTAISSSSKSCLNHIPMPTSHTWYGTEGQDVQGEKLGSKVEKAIKRNFVKFLLVVAVVFVCAVGLAALAPGTFAALSGVSVSAGVLSAATSVVSNVFLNFGMAVTMGIGIYMSYVSDVEQAEARQAIEQEAAEKADQIEEHFTEMEEDRYQDYDGPAIGITWPRDVEEEFESIGSVPLPSEDGVSGTTKALLALAFGSIVYYGYSS